MLPAAPTTAVQELAAPALVGRVLVQPPAAAQTAVPTGVAVAASLHAAEHCAAARFAAEARPAALAYPSTQVISRMAQPELATAQLLAKHSAESTAPAAAAPAGSALAVAAAVDAVLVLAAATVAEPVGFAEFAGTAGFVHVAGCGVQQWRLRLVGQRPFPKVHCYPTSCQLAWCQSKHRWQLKCP